MPLFSDVVASFRRRPTTQPSSNGWFDYMSAIREGSVELTDGSWLSYTDIYRGNVWVRAAVDTIALSLMRMPLHTYTRRDREKERVYEGGLYRLLEVRPAAGLTPAELRAFIGKSVAISGNAIVVKLGMGDESGEPGELFPAPATGWRIDDDRYIWTSSIGDEYSFPRWQIAHYKFREVDQSGFGTSPLEALRRTVSVDDAARRYAEASFRNNARPGAVLKTSHDISNEAAQRMAAEWKALHGGADAAFKTAVLTHGLDYATYDVDLAKSAVVEHRNFTPVEVGAAFRIPAPILGFADEANFASMDLYHQMLYQDALGPWVVMVEERTQLDIVEPTPAWAGQFVEINVDGVLRENLAARYRAHAVGITTGFLTQNEARAMENRPRIDDPEADRLHLPMNLSGAVGAQLAEDDGTTDDETGDTDA